jgi:hypothetical protein
MKHESNPQANGAFDIMMKSLSRQCLMPGVFVGLSVMSQAFAATEIPTGTLNVDRTLVRVGSRSLLDWQIRYPVGITDVVTVTPTGTVIPKCVLTMRVRTLGVAFQSGTTLLPCEGSWSLNNGAWTRFFYGTGPTVVPTKVLVETVVNPNDQINFGGRGWSGSSWWPFHHTRVSDLWLTVLKNGDSAPSHAPAYNQGTIKSFLLPYIDSSGKIRIGNRDLIILWECYTGNPGTTYFDMQDLVALVTFE